MRKTPTSIFPGHVTSAIYSVSQLLLLGSHFLYFLNFTIFYIFCIKNNILMRKSKILEFAREWSLAETIYGLHAHAYRENRWKRLIVFLPALGNYILARILLGPFFSRYSWGRCRCAYKQAGYYRRVEDTHVEPRTEYVEEKFGLNIRAQATN